MLVWAMLLSFPLLFPLVFIWQIVLSPICDFVQEIFGGPFEGILDYPSMRSLVEGAYFFRWGIRGVLKVSFFIFPSRLVDTISPVAVFILPSGFMGAFVKILQLLFCML